MFDRLLVVWLAGLSAIAYFWPANVGDPFLASKPYLAYMIGLTMFCLGSLLPADEVRNLLRQLPSVGLGTLIQCSVMPLAALAVVEAWQFEGGYRVGIILVGCVPGAMASNVLTLAARGNVSYSVSLTTLATVLSPVTVPFLLVVFAGMSGDKSLIDPGAIMTKLLLTVLIPVVVGFFLARFSSKFEILATRLAPLIANLVILWIIAVVVAISRERLASMPLTILAALVVVNLAGYVGGYFGGAIGRLDEPRRRALTLEVGMQNAGLGTLLAVNSFGDQYPEAAIPTAAYTFGCMLTGTLLASYWRMRDSTLAALADA